MPLKALTDSREGKLALFVAGAPKFDTLTLGLSERTSTQPSQDQRPDSLGGPPR